ncbi:MAG: hypothetical protein D6791_02800, partial [Chloroflexi bacterium]
PARKEPVARREGEVQTDRQVEPALTAQEQAQAAIHHGSDTQLSGFFPESFLVSRGNPLQAPRDSRSQTLMHRGCSPAILDVVVMNISQLPHRSVIYA